MKKEQKIYTTESMNRREKTSYEDKEKETLQYIKDHGITDWILLRQKNNQSDYRRLRTAKRRKPAEGSYMLEADSCLLLTLDSAGVTMNYLMQLERKKNIIRCYDIREETKKLSGNDQRIADIINYLEVHGRTVLELKESEASAKKIQEDFEKAKKNKLEDK